MATWKSKPAPAYLNAWARDGWASAPLSERVLMVLDSQVGVKESPSNWGPKVSMYLRAAGILSPAAWCAALLTWALLEAGADRKKLPRFAASTYYWWKWAQENKRLITDGSRFFRGHFGVWNGKGGGHIFAVTRKSGTFSADTIEGNTNAAGAREGKYVMRRYRPWSQISAYPRHGWIVIDDSLGLGA
jgi:hypothetical protein